MGSDSTNGTSSESQRIRVLSIPSLAPPPMPLRVRLRIFATLGTPLIVIFVLSLFSRYQVWGLAIGVFAIFLLPILALAEMGWERTRKYEHRTRVRQSRIDRLSSALTSSASAQRLPHRRFELAMLCINEQRIAESQMGYLLPPNIVLCIGIRPTERPAISSEPLRSEPLDLFRDIDVLDRLSGIPAPPEQPLIGQFWRRNHRHWSHRGSSVPAGRAWAAALRPFRDAANSRSLLAYLIPVCITAVAVYLAIYHSHTAMTVWLIFSGILIAHGQQADSDGFFALPGAVICTRGYREGGKPRVRMMTPEGSALIVEPEARAVWIVMGSDLHQVAALRSAPALVRLWGSVAARPPDSAISSFFDGANIEKVPYVWASIVARRSDSS